MRIVGQERIAEVFGVAPKTIVEWQDQGFPIAQRGSPGVPSEYETQACINWLVERELRKVQAEKPQDRLARVTADKIEMENLERRGLLIKAELLEPKLKAAYIAAREAWLEAVPRLANTLPDEVDGRERLLQAEFEALLNRLADWSHADVDDEEDE